MLRHNNDHLGGMPITYDFYLENRSLALKIDTIFRRTKNTRALQPLVSVNADFNSRRQYEIDRSNLQLANRLRHPRVCVPTQSDLVKTRLRQE